MLLSSPASSSPSTPVGTRSDPLADVRHCHRTFGQHTYPGVRTGCRQALVDGGGDIVRHPQVGRREGRVIQAIGVHENPSLYLKSRLHLHLPLVRHRAVPGRDRRRGAPRRRRDDSTSRNDAVVREARRGTGRAARSSRPAAPPAPRPSCPSPPGTGSGPADSRTLVVTTTSKGAGTDRIAVPAASSRAAACIVEERAGDARGRSAARASSSTSRAKSTPPTARDHRADVVVNRVALDDAPAARPGRPIRAASCRVSTVSSPARPGRHHLRSAAEAREEVRLDEAGRDPEVGLDPEPVEPHRHAVPVRAGQVRAECVASVMVHHSEPRSATPPSIRSISSGAVAAVGSGGDQDDDVLDRHDALELFEDRRDDDVRGCGRVPSHIEIATVAPGRTSFRSGAPCPGARRAARTAAAGSGSARVGGAETKSVRPAGKSTARRPRPYGRSTFMGQAVPDVRGAGPDRVPLGVRRPRDDLVGKTHDVAVAGAEETRWPVGPEHRSARAEAG